MKHIKHTLGKQQDEKVILDFKGHQISTSYKGNWKPTFFNSRLEEKELYHQPESSLVKDNHTESDNIEIKSHKL